MDAAEESGLLDVDDDRPDAPPPVGPVGDLRCRHQHPSPAGPPRTRRRAGRHARRRTAAPGTSPPPSTARTRTWSAALDEAAERARRRGGHEAAAAAWARAAELTTDPEARARRFATAASSSWAGGRPLEAEQLVRTALLDAEDPLLRADLLLIQGQVEWNTRSLDDGYRIVCKAAATAAPYDPSRARVLAMLATALASFGARSADAPDPTDIVPPPGADAPAEDRVAAWLLEGFSAVVADDWGTAATALRHAWATPIAPAADPMLHSNLAISTMHLGDDSRAIALHDRQLQQARDAGAVNMIEHALTRGAVYRIATGSWTEAASAAQEALLIDRNLGLDELAPFPLAELALIAALRGDPEAPRRLETLERALTERRVHGASSGLVAGLAQWAAARQLDVSPATALHHLERIELPIVRGLAAIDRIETASRAGRPELARQWLDELRLFAEGTEMPWAWAAVHHCEAVLGADAETEEGFRRAMEWHERSPRLPAKARTQLAYGEYLRRHRRRTDARVPLREALDTFEGLGAAYWAERARQELRASGETARRGDDVAPTRLTPSEAQIAALVRQGLSNKDVAGRLFVSPRTVDFHLRNVYTKLGITSRTELVALDLDPS